MQLTIQLDGNELEEIHSMVTKFNDNQITSQTNSEIVGGKVTFDYIVEFIETRLDRAFQLGKKYGNII